MKEARLDAACAVFEGRVVASGGWNDIRLNTVEAYDHVANTWLQIPNMVKTRYGHKSVAINNKLFVVSGLENTTSEVFDSTCKQFSLFKQPSTYLIGLTEVISVGSKLFLIKSRSAKVFIYDVEKGEWSEESCETMKDLQSFCCAKVPQL